MSRNFSESAVKEERRWTSLSVRERGKAIARLRKNIVRRQAEIAETVALETGKPVTEVLNQEITATLEMLKFFEKNYPRWLRERRFRYWRPGFWTKSNRIVFEPLGPVAVIGPANFPFSLPVMAACSCLLCGNTLILKPSECCPKTADIIESLVREAGLPEDVWGVERGGPQAAVEVIARPSVKKVVFIGSLEAGRRVAEVCGRTLKPCLLELGGGSAAIICDDADLPWAARSLSWSAFSAAGRSCVGTKLVFVMKAVMGEFTSLLLQEMKAMRLGDVSASSVEISNQVPRTDLSVLRHLAQDAIDQGARIWTQSGKIKDVLTAPLVGPVVLQDLSRSMTAPLVRGDVREPVLGVRAVASVDQAIEEANAYLSGLGASVWSRNSRSAESIARRLRAGLVWINDSSVGLPQFPWGGSGQSGWGRLFSELGSNELTSAKVISAEKHRRARRKFWWFPYSREKRETFLALNELLYGQKRWRLLFRLIASYGKCLLDKNKT